MVHQLEVTICNIQATHRSAQQRTSNTHVSVAIKIPNEQIIEINSTVAIFNSIFSNSKYSFYNFNNSEWFQGQYNFKKTSMKKEAVTIRNKLINSVYNLKNCSSQQKIYYDAIFYVE